MSRGGCWLIVARYCRSSFRYYDSPGYRYISLGFRLLRIVPQRWALLHSYPLNHDVSNGRRQGVSKTAIAKITGVSRTTLYSFMSTRGLRPSR